MFLLNGYMKNRAGLTALINCAEIFDAVCSWDNKNSSKMGLALKIPFLVCI